MKAEYNSLLYAYESNYNEILSILNYDIALEAEGGPTTPQSSNPAPTSTSSTASTGNKAPGADRQSAQTANNSKLATSNTSKNPSQAESQVNKIANANKIRDKIRKLLEQIGQIIRNFSLKLQNRIRLLNQTDKGFAKMYYSRKAMVKPYEQTKVISYAYNNSFIDSIINKLMGEISSSLDKLRLAGTSNASGRISEIVSANQSEIIKVLISPYVKNDSIDTIPRFTKYITDNFRGEKKELVYRAAQLPLIEKYALSTKDVITRCEVYQKSVTASYNRIKNIEYQIRRSDDTQLQNMMVQNITKATLLFNAYTTILHLYFELKLEESLNYRELLKRFYQF